MEDTTVVYLSEEEAIRFVSFQKHWAFVKLLESLDAFNLKNGSLTIHFNPVGQISKLEKHLHYLP